jgi:hypothetical protein
VYRAGASGCRPACAGYGFLVSPGPCGSIRRVNQCLARHSPFCAVSAPSMMVLLGKGTCDPFIGDRISSPSVAAGHMHGSSAQLSIDHEFISLQLPPPCSRSVCLQYLLRQRHRQNVFELAQSQRPSECLPKASLSAEHAAGSEQVFARRSFSILRGPIKGQWVYLYRAVEGEPRVLAA